MVGVHAGESLAGNDSSDALATMSLGRQPVSLSRRSIQSRAMPRSRNPIAARTLSAAPSAPSSAPPKPPRRAPATASADPHPTAIHRSRSYVESLAVRLGLSHTLLSL